jgi:hypothetical protein
MPTPIRNHGRIVRFDTNDGQDGSNRSLPLKEVRIDMPINELDICWTYLPPRLYAAWEHSEIALCSEQSFAARRVGAPFCRF